MAWRASVLFRFLLSVGILAIGVTLVWWLFVVLVLGGAGCDGSCNGIGEFTYDYWWLIALGVSVPIALLLWPRARPDFYRE